MSSTGSVSPASVTIEMAKTLQDLGAKGDHQSIIEKLKSLQKCDETGKGKLITSEEIRDSFGIEIGPAGWLCLADDAPGFTNDDLKPFESIKNELEKSKRFPISSRHDIPNLLRSIHESATGLIIHKITDQTFQYRLVVERGPVLEIVITNPPDFGDLVDMDSFIRINSDTENELILRSRPEGSAGQLNFALSYDDPSPEIEIYEVVDGKREKSISDAKLQWQWPKYD